MLKPATKQLNATSRVKEFARLTPLIKDVLENATSLAYLVQGENFIQIYIKFKPTT